MGAELSTPHRDPTAVQELYRVMSPRLERVDGEEGAAAGESSQKGGEGTMRHPTSPLWADLGMFDIKESLEDLAIQNSERPEGYISSWSGWHDIELQMRYDDLREARDKLFQALDEAASLEEKRDEAVRRNADAKADLAILEKQAEKKASQDEEIMTQEDARKYIRDRARAERRKLSWSQTQQGSTVFTGAARSVAARPSSAHITVPLEKSDHPRLHLGGEAVFRPQGYVGGVGAVSFQAQFKPRRQRPSTIGTTKARYKAPKEDPGAFPRRPEKGLDSHLDTLKLASSASSVQRWRVEYSSSTKGTRSRNAKP